MTTISQPVHGQTDNTSSTRTEGHTSNEAPNAVSSKDFIFKSALISVQKKEKKKKRIEKMKTSILSHLILFHCIDSFRVSGFRGSEEVSDCVSE